MLVRVPLDGSSPTAWLAVAVILAAGCGRTPLVFGDGTDGTTETTGTTGGTEVPPTDSTTDVSTTAVLDIGAGESAGEGTDDGVKLDVPVPKSCRDILECALGCLMGFDLECLAQCGEDAEPGATEAAFDLIQCVLLTCGENGQCSIDAGLSEECLTCVGIKLIAPKPTGCEEQAAACK